MEKKVGFKIYGKHAAEILSWYRAYTGYDRRSIVGKAVNSIGIDVTGEVFYMMDTWRVRGGAVNSSAWAYPFKETMRQKFGVGPESDMNQEVHLNNWAAYGGKGESHPSFNTTAGHVRCLYEVLLGRDMEKLKRKYGEQVFNDIVGRPADPFTVTRREIFLKQEAELKKEYDDSVSACRTWRSEQQRSIEEQYSSKVQRAKADLDQKLAALKTQFDIA